MQKHRFTAFFTFFQSRGEKCLKTETPHFQLLTAFFREKQFGVFVKSNYMYNDLKGIFKSNHLYHLKRTF
jgi:hypothetical protein